VLPWVRETDLFALWEAARDASFATPNIGLLTDMIACPGGDFCALANARSIPIAAAITERFDDLDELYDIGDIDLHISGCINSCGHHHSGHIGILGVDKDGSEWYQVTLGGSTARPSAATRRAGQGHRPVVRGRRSRRRGRGGDRHLPRQRSAQRALHRHRASASASTRSRPPPTRSAAAPPAPLRHA
jgi:sulfite reductase beta subunit-like hemoprotein